MKSPNLLEIICAYKRFEIVRDRKILSLQNLRKQLEIFSFQKKSLKQALTRSCTGIIAEFKRRSPSKGWIYRNACTEEIIQGYQAMGATAVSVLTNEAFFGASPDDFTTARHVISKIPILRKDFIIDEYQIYQSKMIGADVILLIAACLTPKKVYQFTETAHQLDMEVVLEIHNEKELDFIQPNIDVIGINNRDLKTFSTDVQRTIELADKLPKECIKITESGICNPQIVVCLRQKGLNGFLVGEHFMKTKSPVEALKKFICQI